MRNSTSSVERFANDREALDFIASRLADEAQREGIPLSEVERKMLYFSETAWTLPDIWEVSDEFDKECDPNAYEKKISHLLKKAVARVRKQDRREFDSWTAAIHRLSIQDRYLLVMVGQAGITRKSGFRPLLWSVLRPLSAALALLFLFAAFTWLLYRLNPSPGGYSPRSGRYQSRLNEVISFSIWAFAFSIAVIYGLLLLFQKQGKFNEVFDRTVEWIFGKSNRRERGG